MDNTNVENTVRCLNNDCPLKLHCARFGKQLSLFGEYFIAEQNEDGSCRDFIDNNLRFKEQE